MERDQRLASSDYKARLWEAAVRHGMVSHRRFDGADGTLTLSEWESEAGLDAFLSEMTPLIEAVEPESAETLESVRWCPVALSAEEQGLLDSFGE
jgi:hypothetical protein